MCFKIPIRYLNEYQTFYNIDPLCALLSIPGGDAKCTLQKSN